MTKTQSIEKGMIYSDESTVDLCLSHLDNMLNSGFIKDIKLKDSYIMEPSAGNGSFYRKLKDYEVSAIDIKPAFDECLESDFFNLEEIETDKIYKTFIGFPPVREYEKFVEHCFELNADLIAFISPNSATNKKNRLLQEKNGYTTVFSNTIPSGGFYLPNGDKWEIGVSFTIIVKDTYIDFEQLNSHEHKSFKDVFEVYSINDTLLTIRETSQPHLFADGKIPKNRKTGIPYNVLTDDNGMKYYYQHGINTDKKDYCEIFLPLRVFPSNPKGFMVYNEFDSEAFGGIGFGLKTKEGFQIRVVKDVYHIYKEKFKGVFMPLIKLDTETLMKFYAMTRYNNGVYICSKKLIESASL